MHIPGSQDGNSSNMSGNTATQEPDFSEFMWMAEEDLESFDKEVLQEVHTRIQNHLHRVPSDICAEEEVFLQQMLEEEEQRDTVYFQQLHSGQTRELAALQNQFQRMQMNQQQQQQQQQRLEASNGHAGVLQPSELPAFKLNPDAAVFVPRDDNDGPPEQQRPETAPTQEAANGLQRPSDGAQPPCGDLH